jgi:hypothetical protein
VNQFVEFAADFGSDGRFDPTLSSIADIRFAQRRCLSADTMRIRDVASTSTNPSTAFLHVMGRPQRSSATRLPAGTLWSASATTIYIGSKDNNEYLFKVVLEQNRDSRVYVAKLEAQGDGHWIKLKGNANDLDVSEQALFDWQEQARQVGATKIDRPHWCATDSERGQVYFLLNKNNSAQSIEEAGGHIIRFAYHLNRHDPAQFSWDVFLFGSKADSSVLGKSVLGEKLFGELWYSQVTPGLLWIAASQDGSSGQPMFSLDAVTSSNLSYQ